MQDPELRLYPARQAEQLVAYPMQLTHGELQL